MIGRLRGTLLSLVGDSAVIDVSGVGYELTVAPSLGGRVGASVDVVVYTDVKESSISLYGFATQLEREVFLLLKKVKGIGPKMSMGVVSALGAEGVLRAIAQLNVSAIQRVPGVGKKTAERIVMELREEVGRSTVQETSFQPAPATDTMREVGVQGDTLLALEKLGFPSERARGAVQKVVEAAKRDNQPLPQDAGEYLRRALSQL